MERHDDPVSDVIPSSSDTGELGGSADPRATVQRVLRDLRASRTGLSDRDAARRLVAYGHNELTRHKGRGWPRQLIRQLVHPLALLLWLAALLSYFSGSATLALAIITVIVLNAGFAFLQERHAERAVEALSAYLPLQARVLRDGEESKSKQGCWFPGTSWSSGKETVSAPMPGFLRARWKWISPR